MIYDYKYDDNDDNDYDDSDCDDYDYGDMEFIIIDDITGLIIVYSH